MRYFLRRVTLGATPFLAVLFANPALGVGAEHPLLQAKASVSASPVDCLIPFGDGYATWVCDEDGESRGIDATLYAVRINQHGSQVYLRLWRGPRAELTERGRTLVAEHRDADSTCHTYFHVAAQTDTGVSWNVATSNMREAWTRDGASRFHGFCYTAEPSWADFVILWADSTGRIPYSFALPVSQTSYLYGNMNTFGPAGYTAGTFSGAVETIRMQTYQGVRRELNVSAAIFPVELRNEGVELGTPLHRSNETGRWRWSKPGKDVLVDALQFLNDRRLRDLVSTGDLEWLVLHAHGGNLASNCEGVLILRDDLLMFSSTTRPEHQWSEELSSLRGVAKNRRVLSNLNGFHVRLANGRNYNFVWVRGGERGIEPTEILFALNVATEILFALNVANGVAQQTAVTASTLPEVGNSDVEESPSRGPDLPLTNGDIAELVEGGVGDDVIITKIRISRVAFRLGVDELVELKSRGVSDAVLSVMLESSGR